jgi:hypothetical protein
MSSSPVCVCAEWFGAISNADSLRHVSSDPTLTEGPAKSIRAQR